MRNVEPLACRQVDVTGSPVGQDRCGLQGVAEEPFVVPLSGPWKLPDDDDEDERTFGHADGQSAGGYAFASGDELSLGESRSDGYV